MCDIDVTSNISRKDSFIGLKVALNELSNNFKSLDLSDEDTPVNVSSFALFKQAFSVL